MTTATSELPPGYWVDPATGAWCSIPWPADPDERQRIADSSIGPLVIRWAENRLTPEEFEEFGPGLIHYETGEPWRFTRGQKRFLLRWYQYTLDGRFVYRSGVKRGAKGPIAHTTPVMTPTGWTKHGDLRVGDEVFAVDGSITTVTGLRPEVVEDTYRVTFRDGATIDCTGSHRWPVDQFVGGRKRVRRIMTVDDMLTAGLTYERPLTSGSTKATRGGVARFRALPSPAIEGVRADVRIDPYVLGYWLGDGDSDGARVTAHVDDMCSLVTELDRLVVGHGVPAVTHGETQRMGVHSGLRVELRRLGMLGNKHIPASLLRGSLEQRWSLLQGIVDTDGTISRSGQAEISVLDNQLGEDIFELTIGLGLMPTRTYRMASYGGRRYGPYVRIRFTPQPGEVVSRLPRKLARCKTVSRTAPFSRSRTIVAIEKIGRVPARCITVAHTEHQYLVGEHNVPTCNTGKDPMGGAHCNIELAGPSQLVSDGVGGWTGVPHRMPLVQVSSNSEAQSKDMLRVANAMWSDDAREWHDLDCGETRTILKGRGRFEILTFSEASSEGDPATFIALNESHHMTESSGGHRVTAVARRNVGKSPKTLQARLCEYTNAHTMGSDSTAERSFESWQDQVSGRFKNMRADILYDSIEANPALDMTKLDELRLALRQAYSDAPWADLDRLEAEVLDSRTSVAETIRFYLNGLGAAEDAWVDPGRFDLLARPSTTVADGDQIVMFLDCSKSEDATGLVGCRLSDGHCFVLGLWQRPRGDRGKGWLAPRHEVDAVVRATWDRYRVEWFAVDPSPARDDDDESLYWQTLIDQWHRDFGKKLKVWATPGAKVGHAVKFDMRMSQPGAVERNRLFTEMSGLIVEWLDPENGIDIVAETPFTHDGDPGLRLHVQHAKLRPNQWGTSLGKESRDSKKLVDLAVCMVGALMGRRIVLNSGKVRVGARKKRQAVLA